jgi:antitoxin component HigA of HigAB toxin-antitoxin module
MRLMATLTGYDRLLLKVKPQPIRTKADYRRVLEQLDELMEPHPPREVALMIDLLATLVQQYEAKRNAARAAVSPAASLAELLESRELTAAEVSRETGMSRSVLSNALAGRRGISKAGALKLAAYFRVPATVFIQIPLPFHERMTANRPRASNQPSANTSSSAP